MGSGVMHAPLIDLTLPASPGDDVVTGGGPLPAMPVRGSRGYRQPTAPIDPPQRSFAVVAGAPRAGKSTLVDALLGGAQPDRPWAPEEAEDTFVVFRHGEGAGARAFVPGHREPRPIPERGSVRGPVRPARRIEVTHPAPLLQRLSLIDTPGNGGGDPAIAEIVIDTAARGLALLFVVDAAAPLVRAELDLLAAAAGRVERIAFVLTHIDRHDHWPETLSANQALLAAHDPRLAAAAWFPVTLAPGAVFGVAELSHQLQDWAGERAAAGGPAATRRSTVAAATVSRAGDGWPELIDREILARRLAAVERVSIDLATIHVRCVQELGSGKGCPELPRVLDRELHALSARATRLLHADVREVIAIVFGELLDAPPGELVLDRIATAARRAVDGLHDDGWERSRALLVTATSGVAVLAGAGALDSLSASGDGGEAVPPGPAHPGRAVIGADPASHVLAPLGIALNASCYAMWQPRRSPGGPPKQPDKKDCRRWLQHALREVEVQAGSELAERYAELGQALAVIAGDAVDHGVLLA